MISEIKKNGTVMKVSSLGAEPQSLVKDGIEYIWNGDKEYWFRHAPLLFPMIGPTKDDKIRAKGQEYSMPNNGFARDTEFELIGKTEDSVTFRLEDSEETRSKYYPYGFTLTVTYTVTADNALRLDYTASTDRPTPCNLTWHPYFNLHGRGDRSTDSHQLYIRSSRYTPTDSTLIPTGEIVSVAATPADFRTLTPVGAREYDTTSALIRYGKGYDLNFVLDKTDTAAIEKAAELYEPSNGILLTLYTDQPGLQFYSGGVITPGAIGKRGEKRIPYSGIALEPQNFPDAPNHPHFPNSILRPGETYTHHSIYQFSTK